MKWIQRHFSNLPMQEFYCCSDEDNPINLHLEICYDYSVAGFNMYINNSFVGICPNCTVEVAQATVTAIAKKKLLSFFSEVLNLQIEQ